jgi:AraC family transcriptional regulator
MKAGGLQGDVFARVGADGVARGLACAAWGSGALLASWDGLRLAQVAISSQVPEGRFLRHVVMLNVGSTLSFDANLEGAGWQQHGSPHHGVSVLPAGLSFSLRHRHQADVLAVEIEPDFVRAVVGLEGAAATPRPTLGEADSFGSHVMLALREVSGDASPLGNVRARGLGAALVAHLLTPPPAPEPEAPSLTGIPSPHLRRVLDFVAHRLDAPLRVQALAEIAGMNVFRFMRAFKQSTGLSPHQYVLESRISKAKELLRDPALSITDIALQTGFATPSHFSVTFRRIAKCTPREWRDETSGRTDR